MNARVMRELLGSRAATLGVACLALVLAACGGAKQAPGPKGLVPPANAPDWVARGSRVDNGSIFGVGSASGIRNNALARTTAGNRGRAEISKILEVYSASLMKDYSESVSAQGASSESQMVTQAIKTFSANLIEGAEQKDAFVDDGSDTIWVLIELNFERSKEVAAAKADMPSKTREWLDQNGGKVLEDMEGPGTPPGPPVAANDPPPPPPPPVETAPPPPPPPPPVKPAAPPAEGPAPKVGGTPPAWTKGTCNNEKFLCGIGDGADRKAADIDARAELARIFQASIVSVAKSFEGAERTISSKTGETWVEVQNVSQYSMVSTEKVLSMSEIYERWDDGKGRLWSLAVIDRTQAGNALREQIQAQDQIVAAQIERAKAAGDDKLGRFKALKAALAAHAHREALNSDLRVIQKSGTGIPAPHNLSELLAMLDTAAGELKIGVALSGSGSDRVQACLEQALTAKSYQVEVKAGEEEDEDPDIAGSFDVLIKGSIKNEKRDKIAGSEVVNTTLTLRLINPKTNKVVRTWSGQEKASRPSVQAAASTSAFKICQKQVPQMVEEIDRAFSR